MGKECKPTCASRCLADARAFDRDLVVCAAGHTSHSCNCGAALVAKVEAATADMALAAGVTFGASSPEPVAKPARTCNRHDDCDAADAKARANGHYFGSEHCHDECCEDCFGC